MRKTSFILMLAASALLPSCGILQGNKAIKAEVSIPDNAKKRMDKTLKKDQANLLYGEWIILSAFGQETDGSEDLPFLQFNASDKKIYGNIGLNIVNANYSTAHDSLSIRNIITTMMSSEFDMQESLINRALNEATHYEIQNKQGQRYLDITNSGDSVVLHLKRHNADVISGAWKVLTIEGKSVEEYPIQLVIDVPELRIHGNAGCNIINGIIGLDRKKDWFIQFHSLMATRMMCDPKTMAIERDLMVALEEVEIIKMIDGNTCSLLDKNRNEVLALKKIDFSAE